MFPGNCWSAIGMHEKNHSMFHWIGEASRMIADAEDLLYPGAMPLAEVAILYPRSSWLWDESSNTTGTCRSASKSGSPDCQKLGPACAATIDLYCSTQAGGPAGMCNDCLAAWPAALEKAECPKAAGGGWDSALLTYCEGLGPAGPHGTEDQGSAAVDYQAEVFALFKALVQVENIQVDLIDEDSLNAAALSPFKALIVTEPDIPSEGQHAIVKWVQGGGNLLTVSGAATGDQYSQPSAVISSATGIVEAPRPRKMIQWTSTLGPSDTGTGDLGGFTAYGVRGNLSAGSATGPHLNRIAHFSDGSPAIVKNEAVGKGTATHFAFLPGIRFRNQNPYRADAHFDSLVNFTDGSLPYLLSFLNGSGVRSRVKVSEPQVETPLLTSDAGTVLTLLNWREAPVKSLSVTILTDHDVESVTTIASGTKLQFVSTKDDEGGGYLVAFTLPLLEHCDFVTLPTKKTARAHPLGPQVLKVDDDSTPAIPSTPIMGWLSWARFRCYSASNAHASSRHNKLTRTRLGRQSL
eukprot:COSAG04_NODE_2240_length_4467_cov_2.485806_3_plen_521_part_00